MEDSKMKKYFVFLGMAMVGAACERAVLPTPPETERMTVYAALEESAEPAATRVSISDDGIPAWQSGDAIALYNGTQFVTFNLKDASTGAFEGPVGSYTGLAVYPAAIAGSVSSDGQLTLNLPEQYNWQEGQTNAPMIAVSTTDNFTFYPVSGLMKFTYTSIPADVTSLRFGTGSKINGSFSMGSPAPGTSGISQESAQSDPEKFITVNIPAGHPSTMSFYLPVPVSTSGYTGFSVALSADDGVPAAEITSTTNFTLGRNEMRRYKSKDCSSTLPAKLYLVGDCLDPSWGWSESNALVKGEGAVYTGSINLTQNGGFKIYLSKDWSATWLSIDETNSASDNLIIVGGEAYKAAHSVGDTQIRLNNYGYTPGRYTMTVNLGTKRMTLQADDSGPDKLYMVGGCFSQSWTFSESLALVKGANGDYSASGIQMAFGDNNDVGFRIYTVKNDWSLCYTYGNGGYGSNGIQLYYHDMGGDPPQIFPGKYGYDDGTYDVSFNINTMVLTLTPSAASGPAQLYLVGSPFTWSWNFTGTPLARQSSGLYTASDIAMDFGSGDYGFRIYTVLNDWGLCYTYKDGGYDSTGIQLAYHDAGGDPPQIFPGHCGFSSGTYDLSFDISSMWLTLTKK